MTSLNNGCYAFLNKLIQQKEQGIQHVVKETQKKNMKDKQQTQLTINQQQLLKKLYIKVDQLRDQKELQEQCAFKRFPSLPLDYEGLLSRSNDYQDCSSILEKSSSDVLTSLAFDKEFLLGELQSTSTSKMQQQADIHSFTVQRNLNQLDDDITMTQETVDVNILQNNDQKMLLSAASGDYYSDMWLAKQRQNMDDEVLFFVFYDQPNTLLQYQAARELHRRNWRLHSKYCMWFRRMSAPMGICQELEVGDVECWGYCPKETFFKVAYEDKILRELDWQLLTIKKFVFEYKFLVIP
eukprot:TRINITY_DN1960_c0_g1_i1.p1 TRINITY_DN1960_c0_g1~~TRINITY_DN1960_c0_g1_i1.p1  ORF type:complete len:318 (+),score=13.55 TRINITY_DN1960_c0_g1_i1:67-954(+)